MRRTWILLLVALAAAPLAAGAPPDHPRSLTYPELAWSPPDPAAHRLVHEGLASPVVYVVEDASLPLVEVTVHWPTGTADDPPGLADMGADLLLRGGTEKETGERLLRRVEGLGGRISTQVGDESGSASIQVLSRDLPAAIEILADVVTETSFREEEIERWKRELADRWARRNDRVDAMTRREFRKLVLGDAHPLAREATPEDVARIGREELLAWQRERIAGARLIVTLAGDVGDRKVALDRVFARFGSARNPIVIPSDLFPPVPEPQTTVVRLLPRPGATQGDVRIGLPAVTRLDPDWIPLTVMNQILGGGGFPSRIPQRVRSNEGLAYSVGSRFETGERYAGLYAVGFQTRSALVPFAVRIVLEELDRFVKEGATADELARAKDALVERFPDGFDTPEETADAFADLELAGRPLDWLSTYRDRIRAVTLEDVQRVAREHLMRTGRAVILVVGDRDAILRGDPSGVHPERLPDSGKVEEIQVR